MKNNIIKFICLVPLLFSIQGFANPINKIDFVGLNVISNTTLMAILPVKIGDQYNQNTSDEIIQSLFNTGYFSDINVSSNNDNLTITVSENPYIKYFIVNNIKSNWLDTQQRLIDSSSLDEYIESNELSAGNMYTKLKLSDFISLLKSKYTSAGFYNIHIEPNVEIDSQNRIGIDLEITQGKRATINSMSISGSSRFSEEDLLDLFTIGEADTILINFFTRKNEYTELEFNQGIELMMQHYFNSGYLDFSVVSVNTSLIDDNEKINIDIQISEGIQYKLGKISFHGELGNQSISNLNELLSIKSGDIFNRQSLVDDIQKIVDIYADQGYAFVTVTPTTNDFIDKPKVINPASETLSVIFGDNGKHARAAVSTNSLPLGAAVEIDAIFEI